MAKLKNPTSLDEILNEKIKYASEDPSNFYVAIDDPAGGYFDNRIYIINKKTGKVTLENASRYLLFTEKNANKLTDPYHQLKLSK